MERIKELYVTLTGVEPKDIAPLAGAGSNRRYFRIQGGKELSRFDAKTLIGVIGTHPEENESFIFIDKAFRQYGLPVPEILAVSDDQMVYLQQDCGNLSLHDIIMLPRQADTSFCPETFSILCKAIQSLPQIQYLPVVHPEAKEIFSHCFPQREMDFTSVMFDLNYFKYCFVKLQPVEFNELRLQHDFEQLASDLMGDGEDTFLYRDFQSRNVMIKDGEPFFIDFQGGRKGPIYYDVASFLWQSSAKFTDADRDLLINVYLKALKPYKTISKPEFLQRLHLFVLFRLLQVLGAYGYRGLWEKKAYFINSIPLALHNLQHELTLGVCKPYSYLQHLCEQLIRLHAEQSQAIDAEEEKKKKKVANCLKQDDTYLNTSSDKQPLVVQIYSFSFKKGIPADESGNGGGYVFDCRSTHNPGRYDEYKPLTGLDQPVIDFLEADGEILAFLESVYRLVDFHVERFKERGFTHLQISFGCTGGRHRSVYSAQHVAEHIHSKHGVEVHICHREQNISQILPRS